MEGPALAALGDLCEPRSPSPEGETVCAALARYETTLRDAVRRIHADVAAFKTGVERRLDETAHLADPLERAVVQLQQENRQLRNQLEALARQVELLSGIRVLNNNHGPGQKHYEVLQGNHQDVKEVVYGKGEAHTQNQAYVHSLSSTSGSHAQTYNGLGGQSNSSSPPGVFPCSQSSGSPPAGPRGASMVVCPASGCSPSIARFSSRATFALSSKTNSIEREEPIEIDPVPVHTGQENGNHATTEHTVLVHGKISPPAYSQPDDTPTASTRMPHLPITASTKTAEIKASHISAGSPVSSLPPTGQITPGAFRPQPAEDSAVEAGYSVKTWASSPNNAMGSTGLLGEKSNAAPAKSVSYSELLQHERDDDGRRDKSSGQAGERRRELVRSQTLPRSIGAQTRRSLFDRLDSEARNSTPKAVTLKRSQSFGVSSASSIKQILLEWCRSKTIGYQNIDIQNFSSSWSDGMAFCALVHYFFPTEFDYNSLSPANRKLNFEVAFGTAEAKAGCDRLIEVDDMMIMGRKPDPMCVFTYVQSLYNHLRKFE
ncbi:smoothelin, like isoform 1-T2 [Menidia menidia]